MTAAPVVCIGAGELCSPLPGNRLLTLQRDGRALRLAVVQRDGPARRQAGGVTLRAEDVEAFLSIAHALLEHPAARRMMAD